MGSVSISTRPHDLFGSIKNVITRLRNVARACLCFWLLQPVVGLASDWAEWRGPNRDGVSIESGLLKEWPEAGPPLQWKAIGLGSGDSGVAVAKGVVALVEPTRSGYLEKSRFTPPDRSGKKSWAHPVVAGGKLYLRDQDVLLCYNIKAD